VCEHVYIHVHGINFETVSMIFLLYFGTVLMVWLRFMVCHLMTWPWYT